MAKVRRLLRAPTTSGRKRAIDSTIWTIGERVFSLSLTWVVSVLTANYLGVEAWGVLSFVLALVTVGATLGTAGLAGLVVRDLVRSPDAQNQIMGTVTVLRAGAGALVLVALLLLATVLPGHTSEQTALLAVVALGTAFRFADVLELWFQAESELRYVAIARVATVLASSAARLALIAADAPLLLFGIVIAAEQVVLSALLAVGYRQTGARFSRWSISRATARQYAIEAWPLTLSGVANQLNLKSDQIMLGLLASASSVGTYAVAARMSEVWYFVPVAAAAAVYPALIRARQQDATLYRDRLRLLYGAFIWGAIGVAALVTLVAHPLIDWLYSPEFGEAADVLVIHVWSAPFLFMGVVFSRWLILEGLLLTSLVRHSLGATVNIALNFALIPSYGPRGAAIATLVSYATATYGASWLSRSTRPAAVDMTLGFLLPVEAARRAMRRRRAGARSDDPSP